MHWYVRENSCELLSNRANYYRATTFDGSSSRRLLPMLVEQEHVAYTYTPQLDAVFPNTAIQCTNVDAIKLGNLSKINVYKVEEYDSTSPLCMFRGVMPAIEVTYERNDFMLGGVNNMIFLMLVFEWITASFALDYLADAMPDDALLNTPFIFNLISLAWNLVLFVFSFMYVKKLPYNNMTLAWVLALVAFVRQSFAFYNKYIVEKGHLSETYHIVHYIFDADDKDKLNKITTRYFEYAITAPVLLIAVQSIVAQSAGWAFPVAYLCMAVTNLLGIPLHKACTAALSEFAVDKTPKQATLVFDDPGQYCIPNPIYLNLFVIV
jgi:hypothetical protein